MINLSKDIPRTIEEIEKCIKGENWKNWFKDDLCLELIIK